MRSLLFGAVINSSFLLRGSEAEGGQCCLHMGSTKFSVAEPRKQRRPSTLSGYRASSYVNTKLFLNALDS
jgi:hypothetical protein